MRADVRTIFGALPANFVFRFFLTICFVDRVAPGSIASLPFGKTDSRSAASTRLSAPGMRREDTETRLWRPSMRPPLLGTAFPVRVSLRSAFWTIQLGVHRDQPQFPQSVLDSTVPDFTPGLMADELAGIVVGFPLFLLVTW